MNKTLLDEKTGLLRFDWLAQPEFEPLRNITRCDYSAQAIQQLFFTDPELAEEVQFEHAACKEKLPDIIHTLFQETKDRNLHTFFYFKNTAPSHTYIIQKKWYRTQFIFRIHQSWVYQISLGQWEGCDPWPNSQLAQEAFFNKYRGKDLNLSEIKDFFNDILEISTSEHSWGRKFPSNSGPPRSIVTMYALDMHLVTQFDLSRKLKFRANSLIDQEINRLQALKNESLDAWITALEKFKKLLFMLDSNGRILLSRLQYLQKQLPPCLLSDENNTVILEAEIKKLITELQAIQSLSMISPPLVAGSDAEALVRQASIAKVDPPCADEDKEKKSMLPSNQPPKVLLMPIDGFTRCQDGGVKRVVEFFNKNFECLIKYSTFAKFMEQQSTEEYEWYSSEDFKSIEHDSQAIKFVLERNSWFLDFCKECATKGTDLNIELFDFINNPALEQNPEVKSQEKRPINLGSTPTAGVGSSTSHKSSNSSKQSKKNPSTGFFNPNSKSNTKEEKLNNTVSLVDAYKNLKYKILNAITKYSFYTDSSLGKIRAEALYAEINDPRLTNKQLIEILKSFLTTGKVNLQDYKVGFFEEPFFYKSNMNKLGRFDSIREVFCSSVELKTAVENTILGFLSDLRKHGNSQLATEISASLSLINPSQNPQPK